MTEQSKRIVVFHPFLFAVYSVLGAYSQNYGQVPLGWVLRPLFFLTFVTMLIYLGLNKIFKDSEYAGFVSTLLLNWIFMGYLYRVLVNWSSFWHTSIGGLCAFLLASLPLAFLGSRWLWRRLSKSRMITVFLNTTSFVLIIFPLWTTIGVLFRANIQIQQVKEQQAQFDISLANPTPAPDIYLIIVDAYGRADVLHDLYGYNNRQLLEYLKERGFYVANHATSNYPQTSLSLASLLNLQYLNESVEEFGDTGDRSVLYELVQRSRIRQLLHDQDYKFVALASAVLTTQIRDADIYLSPAESTLTEFDAFLLSSTVIGVTVESWGVDLPVMGYDLHRKYVLYSLEKLSDVSTIPGPKIVFAHIMLPHPPFVFDRNGRFLLPGRPYVMGDASFFPGTMEEYQNGYTEQVTYLDYRLIQLLSDILTKSPNPPIIVLLGDHGPGSYFDLDEQNNTCLRERYAILEAFYFPDENYGALYPAITPVNSFRVILNQYFGAELDLLEDRNYYSTWSAPYMLSDVTDQSESCNMGTED